MATIQMRKIHAIALLVSITAGAVLSAQTTPSDGPRGPRRGGPGGRGPGHPIIRALDADKDGVVSAAELANASAAIKVLDTDGDGAVSASELRPARPADAPTPPAGATSRGDRPHPVMPVMLALDANKDGALSASEIANATASLKALDANKDGQLTRDELRPLPPTE